MPEWYTQYMLLEEADRKAVDAMIEPLIRAVQHEEGTVVILADPRGDGKAEFYYGGNALLVEPLLVVGARIGHQFFDVDQSPPQ